MGHQEAKVEQYLIEQTAKRLGGKCFKMTGHKGMPDRMVCAPYINPWFVEVKTMGNLPKLHQRRMIELLKSMNVNATFVSGKNAVDQFLDQLVNEQEVNKQNSLSLEENFHV